MCSHPMYSVPARYYEESSQWQALHSDDFPFLLIPTGQLGTCLWPPASLHPLLAAGTPVGQAQVQASVMK